MIKINIIQIVGNKIIKMVRITGNNKQISKNDRETGLLIIRQYIKRSDMIFIH